MADNPNQAGDGSDDHDSMEDDDDTDDGFDGFSDDEDSGNGGNDNDWNAQSWNALDAVLLQVRHNDATTPSVLDATAGLDIYDVFDEGSREALNMEFPAGYGPPLGQALMLGSGTYAGPPLSLGNSNHANTKVTFLKLMLTDLLKSGQSVLSLTPLFVYVRSAFVLRRLHLLDRGDADDMGYADNEDKMEDRDFYDYPKEAIVALLLEAAGANLFLAELKMSMPIAPLHVLSFYAMLRKTESIHTLDICVGQLTTTASKDRLVLALGTARNLMSLTLRVVPLNADFVNALLLRLGQHPSLKDLCIKNLGSFIRLNGYTSFFQSKRSVLRRLELVRCSMKAGIMHGLVLGLQAAAITCKLETLALCDCDYDVEALAQLLQFFQRSPPTRLATSFLREVRLVLSYPHTSSSSSVKEMYNVHVGATAAKLLVGPPNGTYHSLGCSLRRLVLQVDDYSAFFTTFVAHSAQIRLRSLELGEFQAKDWTVLEEHLPRVQHLQELTISFPVLRDSDNGHHELLAQDVNVPALIRALSGNTSLHALHMKPEHVPYCTAKEKEQIDAILQRNRQSSSGDDAGRVGSVKRVRDDPK